MDNDRKALSLELDRFRTDVDNKAGSTADDIKKPAIDRLLALQERAVEAFAKALKTSPDTVRFVGEDKVADVDRVVAFETIDRLLATYKGTKS